MRPHRPREVAYLVTQRAHGGRHLFAERGAAALFCRVLRILRRQLGFRLYAYVVLPDRVRLILGTHDGDPGTVRLIVQRLKSRFAREVNTRSGRRGLVWQDADERIHSVTAADIARRAAYLHNHPVVARLAPKPRAWRWSSYRAWEGEGDAMVPIDLPEIDHRLST